MGTEWIQRNKLGSGNENRKGWHKLHVSYRKQDTIKLEEEGQGRDK